MSPTNRTRLRLTAIVALLSALVGALLAWLLSRIIPFTYDLAEFENGLRNGAVIGGSLVAFDLFYVQARRGAWLRQLPLAGGILIRAALYTTIIVLGFALNRGLFALLYGDEPDDLDYFGGPLIRDTLLAFVVFFAISFVLQMRRVVGGRVLRNLLLGRYHRPVREDRVFILADIVGSTAIAERLGDERAHALITAVFFDLDQALQAHGAELYSYVGDGLIASWPLAEGVAGARCARCYLAIRDMLAAQAGAYAAEFGVRPRVRVALHAGPVVAGECGDSKLAIVYLGDTLNAAARLEQMAKELDRPCLISATLLARLDLPQDLHAEPLGPVMLKGRQQPMAVHALVDD